MLKEVPIGSDELIGNANVREDPEKWFSGKGVEGLDEAEHASAHPLCVSESSLKIILL